MSNRDIRGWAREAIKDNIFRKIVIKQGHTPHI